MKEIEAIQGEYGYWFEFSLKNADRTTYALRGNETITMMVAKEGQEGVKIGTATVYDAANGIVRVAISSVDATLLTEGRYLAQLWIEDGAMKVATKPVVLKIWRQI